MPRLQSKISDLAHVILYVDSHAKSVRGHVQLGIRVLPSENIGEKCVKQPRSAIANLQMLTTGYRGEQRSEPAAALWARDKSAQKD